MAVLLTSVQPPPFRTPLLDDQGQLVEVWRRFFLSAQAAIVQILAAKPAALVGSLVVPLDDATGLVDDFASLGTQPSALAGIFVPYVGAIANVDLGSKTLTTTGVVGFGSAPVSNKRLTLGGIITSADNAFAIYTGSIILAPSTGWNAYFLYGGGGTVDTGVANTIGRAVGAFIDQIQKIGTGTITNAYGLFINDVSAAATNNYGAYIGGRVGIGAGLQAPTAWLHLTAGAIGAGLAPLKFNSGPLLTTAEAGAIEFLTDAFYGTITTGAARRTFAFLESPVFTGIVTAPAIVANNTLSVGTTATPVTVTVDGPIRVRQVGASRYRTDFNTAGNIFTFAGYDDTGATAIPLSLDFSRFQFTSGAGVSTVENGSLSTSGYWYLGGTSATGLRIRGADTGNTVYQSTGAMGIRTAGGVLEIEAGGANALNLRTNNITRWIVGATGGLSSDGTDPGSTNLRVAGTVATVGKVTTYNNIATVTNGVPSLYATIDTTGLTANVAAATLYAVPATGAGMYRISGYVVETTAASVSSTLPNVQVVYTDNDTNIVVTLDVTPVLGVAGTGQSGALTANVIGTVASGVVPINVKASTTIQYQTVNYASTAAGMTYALHLRCEVL